MITVKLSDILHSVRVFKDISDKNFKGAASFKIAKMIRELDKELNTFDESKNKLLETVMERDEKGEPIIVDGNAKIRDDKVDEYNEKINEMLNVECEINAELLDESYFEDVEITPSQGFAIMSFVK